MTGIGQERLPNRRGAAWSRRTSRLCRAALGVGGCAAQTLGAQLSLTMVVTIVQIVPDRVAPKSKQADVSKCCFRLI